MEVATGVRITGGRAAAACGIEPHHGHLLLMNCNCSTDSTKLWEMSLEHASTAR